MNIEEIILFLNKVKEKLLPDIYEIGFIDEENEIYIYYSNGQLTCMVFDTAGNLIREEYEMQ